MAQNSPRCVGGLGSPDGRSQLRVRIWGGDGTSHTIFGQWEKQHFQFGISGKKNEDDLYLAPWMVLHGFLQAEGRETRLFRWGTRGEWGLSGKLSPCWSADGRRVALLFARGGSGMRDWGSVEAIFRPTRGPRIQVLLPGQGTPPLTEVIAQLEAQGFLLSSVAKAPVRRSSRTVVQYGEGFEDVARRLARQLGDGRALEKLPHVENFDLVIRLGAAMPSLRP
ncbi:LytR C-terminal domain-containing protein [Haliangium sp. UPWRP_2]|uniref:LytR C-terminal domain-containing protein n=1 Tax=Haliangium sp. UPWRP_2 TaxID=1931276 RepID=UPI001E528B9C|nr:LytR C-terminal domain-containing protein [Haliangium sp. UPWRP_2]HNN97946.1 LytR C-terminal domain-containing protein [Pseudomonadota bacterium]